jgi:MoaA/NifB/PqqE/SkfB family radical SAM enzyme
VSLIDKWNLASQNTYRPLQASLELTNRCNERCTHCYIPEYKDDQNRLLTLDQWKQVLPQLRDAGVLYLILMGGEAMLSPHFWGVSEEGARLGFSLAMITNGLLINETAGKRLADVGFSDITISLYSLDPAIHDKMTKVYGSCEKTKKAIEICLKNNLRVSVNCLLTEANIDGYFELKKWCDERHLWLRFDPIITPKNNGDQAPTKYRARPEQIYSFYKKLISPSQVKPLKDLGDMSAEEHACNAGKGKCAVTAYGDLLTCIDIRESLGNLTREKFADIWNGYTAQKWRDIRNKDLKFTDLESRKECEHCPGMAFHETGDAYKVTEYETIVSRAKLEALSAARTGGKYETRKQKQEKGDQEEVSIA